MLTEFLIKSVPLFPTIISWNERKSNYLKNGSTKKRFYTFTLLELIKYHKLLCVQYSLHCIFQINNTLNFGFLMKFRFIFFKVNQ